jgi:hypothetical protein
MTGMRVTATAGIASLMLGIAVGPGLSLFRCLLTGEVSLSCCCERTVDPGGSQDTLASDCCAVLHFEPAGRGLRSTDSPVRPPPAMAFSGLFLPRGATVVSRGVDPVAVTPGQSPPRWLTAGAMLL